MLIYGLADVASKNISVHFASAWRVYVRAWCVGFIDEEQLPS